MKFLGNSVMLMPKGKGRNWPFIFCGYIVNILAKPSSSDFICQTFSSNLLQIQLVPHLLSATWN